MTHICGQEKPPLGEVLEHFGIKGMRWGVRRDNIDGSSTPSKKEQKKAYKQQVKQESSDFYQKKAHDLMQEAIKDPDVLIKLHSGAAYPTVVTGREFVTHLQRGGLMDVKATDIYARKETKIGTYVLNPNSSRVYVAPGRNAPIKLTAPSHYSKSTKSVVSDYNKFTSSDFYNKYGVTKERYSKAFAKNDPLPNG